MAEYLVLAENVIFKNDRLTCINIYDRLSAIAMPAEFRFDLAIMCGPNWTVGEHKLEIKAKANNGKEVNIGDLAVNIPNEGFVYNAYANDLKLIMDYSVDELTIVVTDNGEEIISRKYPVVSVFVPQKKEEEKIEEEKREEAPEETNNENHEN